MMETSDDVKVDVSEAVDPGVPRLPGPPPNPRHNRSRLTSENRSNEKAHGVSDVDNMTASMVQVDSTTDSALGDMSTSAELPVSLEEVKPSVHPSASAPVSGDQGAPPPGADINSNNAVSHAYAQGQEIPVYYSKQHGNVAVTKDTMQTQPDGRQVIQTSQYQSPPERFENRPLTKRYQTILKVLSVVSLVIFFPTGIPAVYFAFQTEKEFNAGILRGDIDKARKFAKRAEKLIIFSFLLCILFIVLAIALYERSLWTEEEKLKAAAGHRILPG